MLIQWSVKFKTPLLITPSILRLAISEFSIQISLHFKTTFDLRPYIIFLAEWMVLQCRDHYADDI